MREKLREKSRTSIYIPEDTNKLLLKYSTSTGIRKTDLILLLLNIGLQNIGEIVKPIKVKKAENEEIKAKVEKITS